MVTLLVIISLFLVLGLIAAIVTGLIAISPVLLVILALPALDILVFKLIFKKKKDE